MICNASIINLTMVWIYLYLLKDDIFEAIILVTDYWLLFKNSCFQNELHCINSTGNLPLLYFSFFWWKCRKLNFALSRVARSQKIRRAKISLKKILCSSRSKKAKKGPNHFISGKLFQKRPNGNPAIIRIALFLVAQTEVWQISNFNFLMKKIIFAEIVQEPDTVCINAWDKWNLSWWFDFGLEKGMQENLKYTKYFWIFFILKTF